MPTPEGTIAFRLLGLSGETENDGLRVSAKRHEDNTVTVRIAGLWDRELVMRQPIPPDDQPDAVHVIVTWSPTEVILYLNGLPAETKALG